MFIRAVEHKNKKNRRKYRTYKLVDSVRTERGPRQTTVLNLGSDFKLPKEDWWGKGGAHAFMRFFHYVYVDMGSC